MADPPTEILEIVQQPKDSSTTHLFLGLSQQTFLAGRAVEGVLVLVVQKPIRVQRLSLIWKGLEYVSWFQGLTGEQNVTGTEWWIARRFFLFPDDGTSSGDKVFEPGTYTYPFVTVLRADLPGSYEDHNASLLDIDFSEGPSINMPDKTCVRYTVTAQCDIMMANNKPGKISTTKPFNVVESFENDLLLQQAAVRKAQNDFFFGGPLTGLLWVANKGTVLSGTPLHIKVDILNKSPYTVEHVSLSVWEHKQLKGNYENQPKAFKVSNKIQEVVINGSATPSGTQKSKTVRFPVRLNHPSITKGKLISVSYELVAKFVYMMDFLELKIPLRFIGVCAQVKAELPAVIPVNIHNDKAKELHDKQYEGIEEAHAWEGSIATY